VNVSADNVANTLTPGFKSRRTIQTESSGGGTRVSGLPVSQAQGAPVAESSAFSLMLDGPGYFALRGPDGGEYFTRNGTFGVDASGFLAHASGLRLQPEIRVPEGAVSVAIAGDGRVSAVLTNGDLVDLGGIEVATFAGEGGLASIGNSLLQASPAAGGAQRHAPGDGAGKIVSGFLESSNTDLISEVVAQKSGVYETKANVGVIRAQDEMLGTLLDIKK
jgi:flagellar basal-body rod protein FlgG